MKQEIRVPWETAYAYTNFLHDSETDGELNEAAYAYMMAQVALQEQAYIAIIGDFRPFRGGLSGAAHEAGLAPAPTYAPAPAGVPAMVQQPQQQQQQAQDGQAIPVCRECGFLGKQAQKEWGVVWECTNPVGHGRPKRNGGFWPATVG